MAQATGAVEGDGIEAAASHSLNDDAATSVSAEPSGISQNQPPRPETCETPSKEPKQEMVVSHVAGPVTEGPLPRWISRFVALPPEIQIMTLSYLDFGDIERLRRTCRFLRKHVSKPMMRAIFYDLQSAILSTCSLCLKSQRYGMDIVVLDPTHPQYPFSSKCVRCLVIREELMVDTKYTLGCGADSFICRLCGYPVIIIEESDDRHFHTNCHSSYLQRGLLFYLVGFMQAVAHIIGTSLCWAFYDAQVLTLGCTTAIFFMAIWGFLLFYQRKVSRLSQHTRTWHWSFSLELAMLALWIAIVYDIVNPIDGSPQKIGASGVATLTFAALNIIIRFVNSTGFLLMVCEIKYWQQHKPDPNRWRRFFTKLLTAMYIWTYPDAVYQQYPAFWFKTPPLAAQRLQAHGRVGAPVADIPLGHRWVTTNTQG